MANSEKNIVITPNVGSSTDDPTIVFSGANTSVSAQNISLRTYPTSGGTLSFEGSSGQLFSVNNDLSGYVYSVNDASGIPLIDAHANGSVRLVPIYGGVAVGPGDFSKVNASSGAAAVTAEWVFRRTTNSTAISGSTPVDVFTTPSSLSLEASSVYEITGILYFLKTTAGTATWRNTFSSAPTLFTMDSIQTAITGMAAATGATYTPLLLYFYSQGATTSTAVATGTLSTAVNHFFKFRGHIQTNAATNWRLQVAQSAGSMTPLAGSYYSIRKVAASTGTFVA